MKLRVPAAFMLLLLAVSCSRQAGHRILPEEPTAASAPVHSAFDFTAEDIAERLSGLPAAARDNLAEFLSLAEGMLDLPPERLVLVDKKHPLPDDFVPGDPVKLDCYPEIDVSRDGMELDRPAAEALAALSSAAAEDGVVLTVSSAYRSYAYQDALFSRYVARDGEETASRYSARPGTSQHQLGAVVDFGDITNAFASSEAGIWMERNAGEFGWSLSYPEDGEEKTGYMWESWHWRWIGCDAVAMQETYFAGSQQDLLEFWNTAGEVIAAAKK